VRLWRAHGLGNDYLVLEAGPPMTPELARALCHRNTGVGGDGVLEPVVSDRADHGVRIWNPDGSVAEKSGNGLRILARWLVDRRGAPSQFSVDTGTDVVRCRVGAEAIEVEMGTARFDGAGVPVVDAFLREPLVVDGHTLDAVAVGVGNPHCVVFCDDPDAVPWRQLGAALEVHPAFPNRTNVQFARVDGPGRVTIRIWERGAGETLASGSSSCAVAAAAVHTGRLASGRVIVCMEGGELEVTVHPDFSVDLRGPVSPVGVIEVDPRWG
jgi:diaminopimelate epimerase